MPFAQRPFGVNLIRHAFEIFGIGEDIRMAARALQTVDVPCCVNDHPAANVASCNDRTLEHLICTDPGGGPHAFNLGYMAAPIQARSLRQLDVVDELWTSSQLTAAALGGPTAEADKPLQVMLMAAEITDPDRFCNAAARITTRQRHGLPAEALLFGYGFDLNSTAIRKNPMGALKAFQRAFPLPICQPRSDMSAPAIRLQSRFPC